MKTRDSLLGRLNPLASLTVLTVVSVVAFFVLDPVTALALYLLAMIGVKFAGRLTTGQLAHAHLTFGGFGLGVLLVNAFTRPGRVLVDIGAFQVTDAGLSVGAALALRVLLIGVLSTAFGLCTDPVRLITALHQHARLSPRFGYAILAGHRMLAGLPAEWQALRAAQLVRAPLNRRGAPRFGPRSWVRAAFGLLVVAIRRGERVAGSLEARGLGSAPRTVWRPVPFTARDGRFLAVCLAITVLVIAGSARVGTLRGLGALFG